MRGRRTRVDLRRAEKDDHIFVGFVVGVEVQRCIWMFLDMGHLVHAWLAEDQEGLRLPDEPDRPWLRGQVRADGGEPDEVFPLQVLFDAPAEISGEVDHSNSSIPRPDRFPQAACKPIKASTAWALRKQPSVKPVRS